MQMVRRLAPHQPTPNERDDKVTTAAAVDRRHQPIFYPEEATAPSSARMLTVEPCHPNHARALISAWHSRLPHTQRGPWRLAFSADYEGTTFAVALWHNPSARGLPPTWLELRRYAVAPDAPHCTASSVLAKMRKYIGTNLPDIDRLISYQDEAVHTGTIYKAAGWEPAWHTKARQRDRSPLRTGTRRLYRWDANGTSPSGAAKTRWEIAAR